MTLPSRIATHIRQFYSGGNWTDSSLQGALSNINWEEAITIIPSFNSIAALVYHINYFVVAVLHVLKGQPLTASDKFSFDCPPIQSQEDWDALKEKCNRDAEEFATLVEQLPEEELWEIFAMENYGTYYRNLHGLIEHNHYHLGQIVLLKKMVKSKTGN